VIGGFFLPLQNLRLKTLFVNSRHAWFLVASIQMQSLKFGSRKTASPIMLSTTMQKLYTCLLFILPGALLPAQPKIELVPHATGFTRPVDIVHCGDSRLFVVEQRGYIWILDSTGTRLSAPFLNIDPRVRSNANEQGLLGLAFPPDYAQSGVFYVYYTRETDGDTRVSRFSLLPGNPNEADPNSEEILLEQNQPYNNHNGGSLKFGPDGYLYIGLGDGGSGGDPQNHGQTKNSLLGKILRIDVNGTSPGLEYAIPPNNPFVGDPAFRPEIWSWGWRNPWRFSFDRLTGDMWVGDVGQNAREEVDFEPAGTGGRNYGWRCYEGLSPYNTTGCQPASNYMAPVFEYANPGLGRSITGGFVYRGSLYADLYGYYFFSDYVSGRWWATKRNQDGTFSTALVGQFAANQYSSYGEDRDGELYVAALAQGAIYKIKSQTVSTDTPPDVVQFSLAPNPTANTVRVRMELKKSEPITLDLVDARQSRIFSKQVLGQRIDEEIDLSLLPAGTYYLVVELKSGKLVRPVVRN